MRLIEMIEEINKNDTKRERLESYKQKFADLYHLTLAEAEQMSMFESYVEYLYNSPDSDVK